MIGSRILFAVPLLALVLAAASAGPVRAAALSEPTIRVPQDQPTLEAAIEAATTPGTLILLDAGTYDGEVIVPEGRPGITIRGVDRNTVVFDGEDVREDAIEVLADDVTLENMTAHNYIGNGFYWEGVDGFTGRYLTVWNVELYGIYAIESRHGLIEQSYVSGAADAAFYIGECNPCDSVITDVTARLSAVGYSGTNAGGNLEIRDSLWELNGTGIMPNSYDGQAFPAPQHDSEITGNTIRESGTVPVPANSPLAGYVGIGIAVNGGQDNRISGNVITGSEHYGIALFPSFQEAGAIYLANGNSVADNEVSGSGSADLAMAGGMQIPSCFEDNTFETSRPADIETAMPCDGEATADTDPDAEADLAIPIPVALARLDERPRYTEMPVPPEQKTMPLIPTETSPPSSPTLPPTQTPGDSPVSAVSPLVLIAVALISLVAAAVVVAALRMRRRRAPPGLS